MSGSGADPAPPARPVRRLFFALWPDAPQRERLARAVQSAVRASRGRPVPSALFHLTLAFLGTVPEVRLGEFAAIASVVTAAVRSESIEVPLERLAYWDRPKVLCALPTRTPAAPVTLAERLLEALTAAGFAPDLKPFRPHVTVARKVPRPTRSVAMAPVRWRFEAFALIESRTLESGPVYSVVEAYPLCGQTRATK